MNGNRIDMLIGVSLVVMIEVALFLWGVFDCVFFRFLAYYCP